MAKTKEIRYTKERGQFICEKIEDGMNVVEICKKYPDQTPSAKSIYRWRRKYPEFKEQYDLAYSSKVMQDLDKLKELVETPLPTRAKLEEEIGDAISDREFGYYLNQWCKRLERRVNQERWSIEKVASKIVPELNDKIKVEGDVGPQIVIQDFASMPKAKTEDDKPVKH